MKILTFTSARAALAQTMEKVCQDHEPVIVTRKNMDSVVILSLEDFETLNETAYLQRSPKNAKRLMKSIEEIENGKGIERTLLE